VCCSVLQCVAVCCSVLQCAAVCCSVLQCVAMCCSVLQCVALKTDCSQDRNITKTKTKTKQAILIHSFCFTSFRFFSFFLCFFLVSFTCFGLFRLVLFNLVHLLCFTCLFLSREQSILSATHLRHTATHCNTTKSINVFFGSREQSVLSATHLQHTSTHLQHTATHCNTLQHTAAQQTQSLFCLSLVSISCESCHTHEWVTSHFCITARCTSCVIHTCDLTHSRWDLNQVWKTFLTWLIHGMGWLAFVGSLK